MGSSYRANSYRYAAIWIDTIRASHHGRQANSTHLPRLGLEEGSGRGHNSPHTLRRSTDRQVDAVARKISGPAVLTRVEVAQVLEVHPATVARWATSGALPSFRTPSGERRYHRQDIEEFLNRPGQAPRPRLVTLATDADSADSCFLGNGLVGHAQAGNRVPGRSRTPSRTACHDGGTEAGD
jgi:excisionase family DNA binding protein